MNDSDHSDFLKRRLRLDAGEFGLMRLALVEPLPAPILADLPPAPQVTPKGRTAFEDYLVEGPHKAFAISASGSSCGYSTTLRPAGEVEQRALTTRMQHAPDCQVHAVDDQLRDKAAH
jgi:hypothetical protein